jgi:hypothetical protein
VYLVDVYRDDEAVHGKDVDGCFSRLGNTSPPLYTVVVDTPVGGSCTMMKVLAQLYATRIASFSMHLE